MDYRIVDSHISKAKIRLINEMLKRAVKPEQVSVMQEIVPMRSRMDRVGMAMTQAPGVFHEQFSIKHVAVEWLYTVPASEKKVLLYFHGGGYVTGSPVSHRAMVSWLAKRLQCRVLTFQYRKAPEHPFPAASEDAVLIYRWLLENGYDASGIAFAGDSAGGGLVFSTLLRIKQHEMPMPSCAVGISPWLDLTMSGESMRSRGHRDFILSHSMLDQFADLYVGNRDRRHPLVSPLFGDVAGFPPVLLQVGSDEVLLDDSVRMMHHLHEAGVDVRLEEWRNMQHVWHFTSRFQQGGKGALKHIAEFLKQHLR